MRLALCLVPAIAFADPPTIGDEVIEVRGSGEMIETASTSGTEYSTRGVAQDYLILPAGAELGGELRLLTTEQPFAGQPIAITDVAFLTLRARLALGHRIDVSASADLLPKQPSTTDELIWQGASLGVTTQPWLRRIALWARATGGAQLDDRGYWGQGAIGVTARKRLHEIMRFEGQASAMGTQLRGEPANAWLAEAAIGGNVHVHDPEGWTAGWFGFSYSLPLAHDGAMLDPQPRMDLSLGVVLSFVDHWDVFARYEIIDRGVTAMHTQLPILDGGFDQRQIIFGATFHTASTRP